MENLLLHFESIPKRYSKYPCIYSSMHLFKIIDLRNVEYHFTPIFWWSNFPGTKCHKFRKYYTKECVTFHPKILITLKFCGVKCYEIFTIWPTFYPRNLISWSFLFVEMLWNIKYWSKISPHGFDHVIIFLG